LPILGKRDEASIGEFREVRMMEAASIVRSYGSQPSRMDLPVRWRASV